MSKRHKPGQMTDLQAALYEAGMLGQCMKCGRYFHHEGLSGICPDCVVDGFNRAVERIRNSKRK